MVTRLLRLKAVPQPADAADGAAAALAHIMSARLPRLGSTRTASLMSRRKGTGQNGDAS
ncbi:MAG TPA: hypothetical protein VFJ96_10270 [Gemmatimonadaceae bacterium]|nr:hypothetical protein [Gemmatimonadaceae bacterium]